MHLAWQVQLSPTMQAADGSLRCSRTQRHLPHIVSSLEAASRLTQDAHGTQRRKGADSSGQSHLPRTCHIAGGLPQVQRLKPTPVPEIVQLLSEAKGGSNPLQGLRWALPHRQQQGWHVAPAGPTAAVSTTPQDSSSGGALREHATSPYKGMACGLICLPVNILLPSGSLPADRPADVALLGGLANAAMPTHPYRTARGPAVQAA